MESPVIALFFRSVQDEYRTPPGQTSQRKRVDLDAPLKTSVFL
jgi:hypothetical protein